MHSPPLDPRLSGEERAPYRVLSLFAGIGGFDLGLERTGGFKTVAFCEIDPFCRRVLAKHWPEVPCFEDVRELTAEQVGPVDVICGGFPCQDISDAGARAGIQGERSGLWAQYARLISELRPRFVIVENVSALLTRGLGRVVGDLASIGYDASWHCIPASAIGAPHRRDRLWLIAYPGGEQHEGRGLALSRQIAAELSGANSDAHSDGQPWGAQSDIGQEAGIEAPFGNNAERLREALADAPGEGSYAGSQAGIYRREEGRGARHVEFERRRWWAFEPDVGRVAHGVPSRVDRLRCLGNAVVPQIPELIGRAILAADAQRQAA